MVDLYMAAALAYCRHKFPYGGDAPEDHYRDGAAGVRQHLEYDARGTAQEPWLRTLVDAVVEAMRTP